MLYIIFFLFLKKIYINHDNIIIMTDNIEPEHHIYFTTHSGKSDRAFKINEITFTPQKKKYFCITCEQYTKPVFVSGYCGKAMYAHCPNCPALKEHKKRLTEGIDYHD